MLIVDLPQILSRFEDSIPYGYLETKIDATGEPRTHTEPPNVTEEEKPRASHFPCGHSAN